MIPSVHKPAAAAHEPLLQGHSSRTGGSACEHYLHFEPLGPGSACLDVPCDCDGRVGLDALGDRLRNDYLFARALIGRLFAKPTVRGAETARSLC